MLAMLARLDQMLSTISRNFEKKRKNNQKKPKRVKTTGLILNGIPLQNTFLGIIEPSSQWMN
jgi:hypothetical protein